MLKQFNLTGKEFKEEEWRWTYKLKIIFNEKQINEATITDHYQKKHSDVVTNELILEILAEKLNNKWIDPLSESYLWERDIFHFETSYRNQSYRLIFWFKKDTSDHLWIRNCYPIKSSSE